MEHVAPWKITELSLDRGGQTSLVNQISRHIEVAIAKGSLQPGGRLPSWRDLAAQLGVARGTVKAAYERLIDKQLIVTAGSAGTHVADTLPTPIGSNTTGTVDLVPADSHLRSDQSLAFQMGVPAHDAFPAKLWSRLHRQAVQATSLWTGHCDPRGLIELRSALASHVAIARGIECSPEQIIVTTGFRGGLAIALRALGAAGRQAWVEDPGYPVARLALELSGVHPVGVRVDNEGLDVERGRELAPRAALAIVTPGQQAPSGGPNTGGPNCFGGQPNRGPGSSRMITSPNFIYPAGRRTRWLPVAERIESSILVLSARRSALCWALGFSSRLCRSRAV